MMCQTKIKQMLGRQPKYYTCIIWCIYYLQHEVEPGGQEVKKYLETIDM